MRKLVVINGSPRTESVSNTYKALKVETMAFREESPTMDVVYFHLPTNMQGCIDCEKCNLDCNIRDVFQSIAKEMEENKWMVPKCVYENYIGKRKS